MNRSDEHVTASSTTATVLVINDRAGIADQLRRCFPDRRITVADTYLSGITELSRRPVDAVLAYVEPSQTGLSDSVAGLREAAGRGAKLLLCCPAEAEPLTRDAIDSGADDYLICPLRMDDLEAALVRRGDAHDAEIAVTAGATLGELKALGQVVSRLNSSPGEMLDSLANLLRTAMGSAGARVVVEGTSRTSGVATFDPEMLESLYREGSPIGHIAVGQREAGDYSPSDTQKLRLYATLIGDLLSASMNSRRWYELAYTDELSRLPNRRYLLEFLGRVLDPDGEDGANVTLFMFDIDNFKQYNDAYGHDAGDEIIRGCGELFLANVRDHDIVTRYGGDEFAVVFWDKGGPRVPGSHHPKTVLPLIERFRRSLQAHQFERFKLPEDACLTISGGLAGYPQDAKTIEDLITRADEALLRAKRDGKNRVFLGGESGGPALGADPPEPLAQTRGDS